MGDSVPTDDVGNAVEAEVKRCLNVMVGGIQPLVTFGVSSFVISVLKDSLLVVVGVVCVFGVVRAIVGVVRVGVVRVGEVRVSVVRVSEVRIGVVRLIVGVLSVGVSVVSVVVSFVFVRVV